MSVVTDIYDQIITRLGVVLTTHKRLPNPYIPEQNAEPTIAQGFGVKVGGGENLDLEMECTVSYLRQYSIVLTRRFKATENDADKKADAEKLLLEDLRLVLNDVESEAFLDPSDTIASWKVLSDTGILFVFAGDKPFYQIEVVLEVKYFEHQT